MLCLIGAQQEGEKYKMFKRQHSYGIYFFLMLATIACLLISGGCGGSSGGSSSVNSKNSMTLAFDTDKDGVPDIFDAFPK